GFVDLIFEEGGRYYLVDYKTNFLGDIYDDYATARLSAAMSAHSYHWQYLFYTLALHRHLRLSVGGNYDYARDFAGAYYLFVRGMRPDLGNASGVYHDRVDPDLILTLDDMLGGVP
ncbi:MAG: PD-(D/E)XK nuclease family protein, partial [Xanthomonadales bacterium]|nr:PD-(D/E)XK nuclease family protein [Xanthomonadales bacterium]